MSDDYNFHLNAPGAMVSDALSRIVNSSQGDSPKAEKVEINDELTITSGKLAVKSRQVIQVFVDDNCCKVTFSVTKDKALLSQAFYKDRCDIAFGSLYLNGYTCTSWEYNSDNRVIITFHSNS